VCSSDLVLSGVAIIDEYGNRALMWDESVVSVGRVEKDVREAYIATGGWRGKAGAYNLSERIADGWPITFEGDPTTVMGLPMQKLGQFIERFASQRTPGAVNP